MNINSKNLKNRFLTILEYEIIHFLKNMHKPKIIWAGCCNFYKIPKSRKKKLLLKSTEYRNNF
jgi:tmRNA-binding protein